MRLSGNTPAAFILLTSWTKMGSLSSEMPSCLFQQVCEFTHHSSIFTYFADELKIFLLFSLTGRRQCPGESLARMEIFLFFTSLLQHFRFTPPPGVSEDELDLTPIVSAAVSPSPHKLCAVPVV